jgi:hypothetical protein
MSANVPNSASKRKNQMTDDKAVTKKANTEMALPMKLDDLKADAKLGGEMGLRDIAIPFVYILQSMSPQVVQDHPKFIEGARAGMIYLTGMEKVFEGREAGLKIVPCHYERLYSEWIPRDKGGGLVGSHTPNDKIVTTASRGEKGPVTASGNLLTETAYHAVLVYVPDSGAWVQAVMPMKSTGLKASRRLNTALSVLRIPGSDVIAPRFLYTWKLTTAKETRDTHIWSVPKFEIDQMVSSDLYKAAKSFSVIAGTGLLRREAVSHEASQDETLGKTKEQEPLGDEIPF